jgi:hypothetical protein
VQVAAVIYVSPTISLIVHGNLRFNIIFWCCVRFNGLQRYSHSSAWSRNVKAAYIERIMTLEWQIRAGDCDWPG